VPHLYLKYLCVFSLGLAVLSLAARTIGIQQPTNPAVTGFLEGCQNQAQACWYGIVPSVTGVNEVLQTLATVGEPEVARSIFSRDYTLIFTLPEPSPYCRLILDFVNDMVVEGQLSPCLTSAIRVGDIAAFWGSQGEYISLPPNRLVYKGTSLDANGWPDPFRPIYYMRLLSPDTPIQHFPWHGFLSRQHYCQIVPTYPLCS